MNNIRCVAYCTVFLILFSIIITNSSAYADTLLGAGIKLKISGNSTSGIINLKGQNYKATNLSTTIKNNQIKFFGYIDGSYHVLFSAVGVHTNGLQYKFDGVITNNGKSTPVSFTTLLTSDNANTNSAQKPITSQTLKPTVPNTLSKTVGIPMLMLTSSGDRVYMAYSYNFMVKTFDPKSNPQKIFDQFNGGISDVNISVTIVDSDNKVIGQAAGKTDSKGIYQDLINIPYSQYSQQQTKVIFNATKNGYVSQLSAVPLLVIHPNSGSSHICLITTGSLPSGTNGVPYSQTLTTTYCNSPLSWAIQSGSLPNGLSLGAGTGIISGTPTLAGTFNFVVKVTDSRGSSAVQSLSITIN